MERRDKDKGLREVIATTSMSLSDMDVVELFEKSGIGVYGLSEDIRSILEYPVTENIYKTSLLIDVSELLVTEEVDMDKDKLQDEVEMLIKDISRVAIRYKHLLEGRLIALHFEKPNILIFTVYGDIHHKP